jgi:hypothetical protein
LSGNAFDHREDYSEADSAKLREDINELFAKIVSAGTVKDCLAVMTAGAPGAGKTMNMRQDLEKKRASGLEYAYICPDDVAAKNLTRTYVAEIESGDQSKEARLAAYNKWRPASNAAAHLILGNLIREKYAFYFGTTSTGPATGKFFEFLKREGYQIRLIHLSAPDDVRWESIVERDKTYVQTTEADVKEKALLLPQRINDTFLAYADRIEFCYRGALHEDAKLAAVWIRNPISFEALGTLEIIDHFGYAQIKAIHNRAVIALEKPELLWESAVEAFGISSLVV